MCFNIVFYMKFFDLWGFLTGYPHTPNYHRFACFILFLHYCLAIFLTLYMGYIVAYFFAYLSILDAFNEFSQYGCLLVTYWIIIIETYWKRSARRSFWTFYEQVNNSECIPGNFALYKYELIEYFVVSFITEPFHWIIMRVPLDVVVPYFILYHIIQVRVFYHIFCLKLIACAMNNIDDKIEEMKRFGESRFGNTTSQHSHGARRRQFCQIQRMHLILCELVQQVNDNFRFSILATILCQCCILYSNLNWAYLHGHQYGSYYKPGIVAIPIDFADKLICTNRDLKFIYLFLLNSHSSLLYMGTICSKAHLLCVSGSKWVLYEGKTKVILIVLLIVKIFIGWSTWSEYK